MDSHFNDRLRKAQNFKKNKEEIQEKAEILKMQLRNLKWTDIELIDLENKGNTKHYQTKFPSEIQHAFEQLAAHLPDSAGDRYYQAYHELIYGHVNDECDNIGLTLSVGLLDHRVDVLNSGLPYSLRGLGLGSKLYKRLMREYGYIYSEERQSGFHSDLVWDKLTKDEEVHVISTKTCLYACLRSDTTGRLSTLNDICEGSEEAFFPTSLIAELKDMEEEIRAHGFNALDEKISEN